MSKVVPIPVGAHPLPSGAEQLRRLVQNLAEIDSRLNQVLGCAEPHGIVHLAELEAAAATTSTLIAGFDHVAAQAHLAAALRPATRQQIAEMAAALVGAYPSADRRELAVFGNLLPREIGDLEPSIGSLELGLKIVLDRSRFMPAIGEVVAAVEAAQAKLVTAADQIPKLEEQQARMTARLDQLRDRARKYHAWCENRRQA